MSGARRGVVPVPSRDGEGLRARGCSTSARHAWENERGSRGVEGHAPGGYCLWALKISPPDRPHVGGNAETHARQVGAGIKPGRDPRPLLRMRGQRPRFVAMCECLRRPIDEKMPCGPECQRVPAVTDERRICDVEVFPDDDFPPGLNDGDIVTTEKTVDGRPVGFYLNPDDYLPQQFRLKIRKRA